MSSNFTPTSPQLPRAHDDTENKEGLDKSGPNDLPEEKKARKKILADSKQIAEARRKHGKLRLSDLLSLGSSSDEEALPAVSPQTSQAPLTPAIPIVQPTIPVSLGLPQPRLPAFVLGKTISIFPHACFHHFD